MRIAANEVATFRLKIMMAARLSSFFMRSFRSLQGCRSVPMSSQRALPWPMNRLRAKTVRHSHEELARIARRFEVIRRRGAAEWPSCAVGSKLIARCIAWAMTSKLPWNLSSPCHYPPWSVDAAVEPYQCVGSSSRVNAIGRSLPYPVSLRREVKQKFPSCDFGADPC